MNSALFALAALVPAMIGPPTCSGHDDHLRVGLCGGGSIVIPLPDKQPAPTPGSGPKICHAACSRRRFDSPQ